MEIKSLRALKKAGVPAEHAEAMLETMPDKNELAAAEDRIARCLEVLSAEVRGGLAKMDGSIAKMEGHAAKMEGHVASMQGEIKALKADISWLRQVIYGAAASLALFVIGAIFTKGILF